MTSQQALKFKNYFSVKQNQSGEGTSQEQAVESKQVKRGRPPGVKNKVDHKAGGQRNGAGNKAGSKRVKTDENGDTQPSFYVPPENRGGARVGAGRKKKKQQKQNDILPQVSSTSADTGNVASHLGAIDPNVIGMDTENRDPLQQDQSVSSERAPAEGNTQSGTSGNGQSNDHFTVPLNNFCAGDESEDESDGDDLEENVDEPKGVVKEYLDSILDRLRNDGQLKKQIVSGQLWIVPPNPEVVARNQHVLEGGRVKPDQFYLPKVYCFVPHWTWPYARVQCPQCQSDAVQKGWHERFRRVIDMDQCYFIATCRYMCDNGHHFVPTVQEFIHSLPQEIQIQFPAVFSYKLAVDSKIIRLLHSSIDASVGPTQISNMLKEWHTLRHTKLELQYYSMVQSILKMRQPALTQKKILDPVAEVPKFSSFADKQGYCGHVPSSNYMMKMLMMDIERKKDYFDFEVQRRDAEVICADHSFKVTRHMGQLNGVRTFEGLHTVLNEYEEIRSQSFVQSTSHQHITQPLKAMYNTLESNGMKTPQVVYTDICCQDRQFYESVFPSLRVGILNKPLLGVEMSKVFVASDEQTLKVQQNSMVNEMKEAQDGRDYAVGLDCEWEYSKESGNGGKIGKVSVLQLCFPGSKVLIIQLCHLKQIPTILSLFLRDASIQKVGRKVGNDARLLMQDYNLMVESVEDLAKIAKDKGLISSAKVSLRTLTQQFLGFDLDKDEGVRGSKWSARKLTELQITYAARDAVASLSVYEAIVSGKTQFTLPSSVNEVDSEIQSPQSESTDHASFPVGGDGCSRVKLDAWHAMKRICTPRHHAFQYEFCSQLRDAIFVVNQEDANDVARVLNLKGLNYDDVMQSKPDYILQRVRRLIPPAPVLVERLRHVLLEFSQDKYTDPDSGKPLLDSVAKEEFAKLLIHAGRGCLSDPQSISLYYEKGKDKDGLTLYRCIRGSSSVEGAVHQKLAMKFQPWNAGPKYADLAAAVLRHRYNVRASQRNRPGFPTIGHYNHDLIDKIQDITQKIYGLSVHDWWTPINQLKLHGESFGILPVVSTDQQVNVSVSDPRIEKYTESMKYLAVKMKTLIPHLPIYSVEEMKCFNVSVSKYMRGTFKQIDYKLFADDWNAGRLKGKPDGISITCKLPEHLESYYKTFLKALTRKNAISFHSLSLQMVKHQLSATVALDHHFPAVGESKQLYPDRMITLLANPVANELDEQLDLDAIVDDEESVVVEQSSSLTVRQVGFVSNEVVPQMRGQTDLTPAVTDSGIQKNLRLDKKCKNCGLRISQGCNGGTRSKCVLEGGPVPKQFQS
ncbi:hypothetical protein MP228_002560 [Amoeboaphelidium protococcarum]|nr:hypothetical protein MP228_002560 [Amoeboaphelidium protococcarum]